MSPPTPPSVPASPRKKLANFLQHFFEAINCPKNGHFRIEICKFGGCMLCAGPKRHLFLSKMAKNINFGPKNHRFQAALGPPPPPGSRSPPLTLISKVEGGGLGKSQISVLWLPTGKKKFHPLCNIKENCWFARCPSELTRRRSPSKIRSFSLAFSSNNDPRFP